MDAIDTTYQNLPNEQVASQAIEKCENVAFEDAIENAETPVAVEAGSSFEDLMSSILEVALEDVEELVAEENSDTGLLVMDIVNEQFNLSIDSSANKFLDKNPKTEIKEIADRSPVFDGEEITAEEIPFVEFELNVAENSGELKKLRDAKVQNEKTVIDKGEEKKEEPILKDDPSIKNAVPVQHKKIDNNKKDEHKKEDKIEEKQDVDMLEAKVPQKQRKVQAKKLPIVVEDLRTIEEAKITDIGNSSFEAEASSEEFSSHYSSSDVSTSHASETSSLNEGHGVQSEGQFAAILAEQIKENSAELVERGKIVLRDGNVGEIRLQLKPAHLGSVKIQLKMSGDKKMQGEVTVSSKEAFDAFEESMQDLVASFNEAGFDASGFNLNWKSGEKEEIVRDDLSKQYFSPEKTHLSLSERLNFADNVYRFDQAKNLNILA